MGGDFCMRLPKFSAEAGLYVTTQPYRKLPSAGHQGGGVQPAFTSIILGNCFGRCVGACVRGDFYCYSRCLELCGLPVPTVRSQVLEF